MNTPNPKDALEYKKASPHESRSCAMVTQFGTSKFSRHAEDQLLDRVIHDDAARLVVECGSAVLRSGDRLFMRILPRDYCTLIDRLRGYRKMHLLPECLELVVLVSDNKKNIITVNWLDSYNWTIS